MLFRLSTKLAGKLKIGKLEQLPIDSNPLLDWSAHLFIAERAQYIILTNTQSLYSTIFPGRGVSSGAAFVEHAREAILNLLAADGHGRLCPQMFASPDAPVQFSKAHSRSVTGSMNDFIKFAKFMIVEDRRPLEDVIRHNNDMPMSAIPLHFAGEQFAAMNPPKL